MTFENLTREAVIIHGTYLIGVIDPLYASLLSLSLHPHVTPSPSPSLCHLYLSLANTTNPSVTGDID